MADSPKRPLRVEDLLACRKLTQPCYSPADGSLVFVASLPNVEENRNESHLYRIAPEGGEPVQLTRAGSSNTNPAFSPDGRLLAFSSKRDGAPQIWLLPLGGGEPYALTRLRLGARRPVWFPDGKRLLATSSVYLDTNDEAAIIQREEERKKRKSQPRVIDELMFRHWDSWSDDKLDHLFAIELATGAARDLTPGPYPVPPRSLSSDPDYAVSPDGRELCFVSLRVPEQALSTNLNLWTLPAEGGAEPRRVSPWDGANICPAYSPDGRFIAYCGMRRAGYEADKLELLVYERATGKVQELAPGFDRSAGAPAWSPDGTRLYFHAQDRGRTRLYTVPASGGEPLALSSGATDLEECLSADGAFLAFTRQSLTGPSEIARLRTSAPAQVERLTRLNQPVMAPIDLAPGEEFWFKGADDLELQGFIVKPPGFDPGRRYPVVFLIHGGPQQMFGDDFHERWNPQLFAAPGYVCVTMNPRGSTGYGQALTDAIRGEWGGKCYLDLMAGVDHVLASLPYCDPGRTAAAGASFGGFMVNWIAGQTNRFRCLVSHDGIFNNEMMDYATDELWFSEWEFGGAPWEAPEEYSKWSPHRFVDRIRTPMLVIHGEQDFRCVAGEGLTLFTALRRRGVPARLLYFPDEGHWVLKPQNRKVWWQTVHDWLARYL